MELTLTIGGASYRVNTAHAHDIAIPVKFDGGLSAFGAPAATRAPYHTEGFIGAVSKGGSCNCDMLHFAPHLHGTHTESIGHITKQPMPITQALTDSLIPATLITVTPESHIIIAESLKAALKKVNPAFLKALIVRTLPNTDHKKSAQYGAEPAAYFTKEAMEMIVAHGVTHLLCDLPSVDKMDDGGKLSNHRIFWEINPGVTEGISNKTITELIYVNDAIADGNYLLNLQVAPLVVDAAPSRPLLYEITRL